jgi:carbon monoxide dehydrogenase subunit G
MELENDFVVPVPKAQAWAVLMDVERIAPCLPGATFDGYEGDGFKGRVKVKLGPITVTYNGTARFEERDEAAGRAVIEAAGKEARGSGTASATIRAQLDEEGSSTRVKVVTDLNVTGKPAQFGRGVMAEVGAKLIGQFATCLADQLGSTGTEPPTADAAPAPLDQDRTPTSGLAAVPADGEPSAPRPSADAIDLMDAAGVPVLKRALPAVLALLGLFVLWRLLRRNRS